MRITRPRFGLALLGLVCGSLAATGAEPAREKVTLERVLTLLRERSPRIAADRAEIDIAQADVVQAEALPNPSVSYGWTGTVHGTDTIGHRLHAGSLDVPLLLAGQRPARRKAAELGVMSARSATRARYADAALDARHLFITLLADQERVRLLEAALTDVEGVARIVEGRAEAGTKSAYDVERIHLEVATQRNRLAEERTVRDATAGDLAKLVGIPNWFPEADGELRPREGGGAVDDLWKLAEATLPAIDAAERREKAAEAAIEVASSERWPVPVVSVGGLGTTDPAGIAVGFGISLPLPLFDRGQGAMAKARAEALSARRNREAVLAESRLGLEKAHRLLALRKEALASFERDVMSRLPALRRMAEDAYRNGQGGIVEFLDALRAIIAAGPDHADLLEGVLQAEVDVQAAAGALDVEYRP